MPKRKIAVLDHSGSPWPDFLKEYFEDTASEVKAEIDPPNPSRILDAVSPQIVFAALDLLNLTALQKIKAFRQSSAEFRIFALGTPSKAAHDLEVDAVLERPEPLEDFQKSFLKCLPLPAEVEVLVIDDEREIGNMIREFLDGRSRPSFTVRYAENGARGLEEIRRKRPDVVLLDMKMPVKNGREVYGEILKDKIDVPVIAFFDAVSGDEVVQLRELGRPSVVDKCSRESAMPAMLSLIKKKAYFG